VPRDRCSLEEQERARVASSRPLLLKLSSQAEAAGSRSTHHSGRRSSARLRRCRQPSTACGIAWRLWLRRERRSLSPRRQRTKPRARSGNVDRREAPLAVASLPSRSPSSAPRRCAHDPIPVTLAGDPTTTRICNSPPFSLGDRLITRHLPGPFCSRPPRQPWRRNVTPGNPQDQPGTRLRDRPISLPFTNRAKRTRAAPAAELPRAGDCAVSIISTAESTARPVG
jgi:hypothetical protein